MRVKNYFDKIAKNYNERRTSGVLGRVVAREKSSVMRLIDAHKEETILDAGCGSGFYSIILKDLGSKPFGVDISPKMVELTKKQGVAATVSNLEELNLGEKFDKVLCAGALEFCNDPLKVVENLKDHLRKGGYIVLLVPRLSLFGIIYFMYHLLHGMNIKLFTMKELIEISKKLNLEIITVEKPNPHTYALKIRV